MNNQEDPTGGLPTPADDAAARLARDDIYRLVALLWQLDRLHRPVLLQAPGDFRIAADPPALLPPTGFPGMSADQAPQVWAPEPARRPQRPLPPVTVAWVEPAAVTAERQVAVPTPQPPAPQDPVRQPPRPWQPAPAATATPPEAPEQPVAQRSEPAGAPTRANPTVPRGPASPPDTQPTQPAGRTRPGGEGPGGSRDSAPASAEPDRPDSPPSRPPVRPPTESTQFRPDSAAPDRVAGLPVTPAPAPGSPDLAAMAGVPTPGVPPGPRMPRPTAASPPAMAAPPAVGDRRYSQLAPQESSAAAGQVAAAPALRPPMANSAVTTRPQPGPDPTVIVPTGHFSPSPVPAPADDPRPELDEADFDEDWDDDPLPDPGRYRQAIVMRRGQQAGALTRTEAARLEEELRRRFRDRSPGGSP